MGIRIFNNIEIDSIILDESALVSISWLNNNGIDIRMEIDWCGQENLRDEIDFLKVRTYLHFVSASNIDFSFQHKENWVIGFPEISTFSFIKEGSAYKIRFEFYFSPVGYIELQCYDFRFEVIPQEKESEG